MTSVHASLVSALVCALVACNDTHALGAEEIGFAPPPSATGWHNKVTGIQATMRQARFEIAAADLPVLAARLPCRLGPPTTDAAEADEMSVGTNDRSWWRPEEARRHRGCTHSIGIHTMRVLVDLDRPARPTVYLLVMDD